MLLSCPLCCKPHFEGVDSLRTTLINVATAPLKCPVCQEILKGLDKLTIHLFGHVNVNQCNSDKSSVGDSVCDKQQCSSDKEAVMKNEIDRSIKKICADSCLFQVEPQQSSGEAEKSPEAIISCDICNFTFTDRNILEMHQKLLHQTSPDEKTGKYSYHCHLCSKRFKMRGSLMVHLRVAHYGFNSHLNLPHHMLNNNNAITNNTEPDVMETDKGLTKSQDCKQWSCDVCAKMFTTKYFLKKHKRLHTGEMPYSCSICNKSFTFQQSYHKHMLYHSSEKPYLCTECGRSFKEHSTLQNHARIHSGERPFGCEICGKRFRQRVSYLVHMRIHTGVMPYKCTACNKSFRYKVSQRSHKCPMNPPGSVIRITDSDNTATNSQANQTAEITQAQNDSSELTPVLNMESLRTNPKKCIMSVDYNTGSINLISGAENKEMIRCDGKLPANHNIGQSICSNVEEPLMEIDSSLNRDPLISQRDIYSVLMSPIIPEVESLCLNNDSPISHPTSPVDENIQVIREKCLQELFQ